MIYTEGSKKWIIGRCPPISKSRGYSDDVLRIELIEILTHQKTLFYNAVHEIILLRVLTKYLTKLVLLLTM